MAKTGKLGTEMFIRPVYDPKQEYQNRSKVFFARPSPLLASEGSVAFQTPCYGIWAHVPHRGFQVLEVTTLPE